MTFEERFEKLEKQNRKLRKWMAGIGAIAVMALIGGTALSVRAYTAAIEPASITTQQITIKDSSGRVRAQINPYGSFLSYDVTGKTRATVSSGGYIQAYDANGKLRVRLNGNDNKIYFYNASGGIVAAHP